MREADIPADARTRSEAAANVMVPRANLPPRDKLPADARRMRTWAFSQVTHWAANDNPFEAEELAALITRSAGEHPFGDTPLVVLSRGRPESGDAEQEAEHRRHQAELAALSRDGRQVVSSHSGHEILLDDPELVVAAIREVFMTAVRR